MALLYMMGTQNKKV